MRIPTKSPSEAGGLYRLKPAKDSDDPGHCSTAMPSAARGLTIAACYVENESGAKLARPELFRMLADAQPGDILLVQVDRLSRLTNCGLGAAQDRVDGAPRPRWRPGPSDLVDNGDPTATS